MFAKQYSVLVNAVILRLGTHTHTHTHSPTGIMNTHIKRSSMLLYKHVFLSIGTICRGAALAL